MFGSQAWTRSRSRSGSGQPIEQLEPRRLLAGSPAQPITAAALAGVPARVMENLGRGVVAVRSSNTQAFISWRLLGLDPTGIAFNVYRSSNGGTAQKLNSTPLTAGTNYTDTPPSLALPNTYTVRPVIGGVEQPASAPFTLAANAKTEPVTRIPIAAPLPGYRSKSIWVGDLDGDGEYDYVVDRIAPFYVDPVTGVENNDIGTGNQFVEAFTSKGVKLWTIDMGPTSRGTYNISPGAATISMGMWDGVTVQDLNLDGKAEVVLKIANGVKFADGSTFTTTNDQRQFISVVNGLTGTKMAHLEFPSDHAFAGRLATMLGVGYLDGVKPGIVGWLRNRNPDSSAYGAQRKQFNDIMIAWEWNGGSTITQKWKLLLKAGDPAAAGVAGFHQMRIIDVNGDGADDVLPGNYAISGKTGQIIYKIAGIGHGDRFHVGDFDPDRPGLEGFGIQQNSGTIGLPNMVLDYYYDADTGEVLWTNNGTGYDVGRGAAGDIDPSKRGYEVWSFEGIWNHNELNQPKKTLVHDKTLPGEPWPNLRIWWDGDLGSEELDATVINKYNAESKTTGRLVTGYKLGATTNENFPGIYGDIMGDWREEAVYMNSTWSELLILTTNVPTATRLYTLPHNPGYRNSLTVKGYYQSNHVDYYLGYGMTTPPTPNISYAGVQAPIVATKELIYQSEAAARAGGTVIESNHLGYTGTGFANLPTTGGSLQWNNVDGGTGGATNLRVRFAMGAATARIGRLTVNGVAQSVTFEPTGAWANWSTLGVTVTLAAGRSNIVRLESTGQDYGNIDELQVDAVIPAAPGFGGMTVGDGTAQRSMVNGVTLQFDRAVNLGVGAVTLNRTGGGAVTLLPTDPTGDGKTWVLAFSGTGISAGSLGDGAYTLSINAALVTDAFGQTLTGGNRTLSLHRLFGDTDGDRDVDNADLARLRGAMNVPSSFKAMYDFNGDGRIDNVDLLAIRQRLNVRL